MKKLLFPLLLLALATAARAQFTVSVTVSPAGSGVLSTANGACQLGSVTTINFGCTVTPAPGFTFKQWIVLNSAGTEQNGASGIWCDKLTGTTCGPLALTSTGGSLQAQLVANSSGGGGTTSPSLFCANDPNPACGVALSWVAPASGTDPATGYLIFRAVSSSSSFTQLTPSPITTLTYTDKTINASTSYQYYVVSVDANGVQGVPSNTASVIVGVSVAPPQPGPASNLVATLVQ